MTHSEIILDIPFWYVLTETEDGPLVEQRPSLPFLEIQFLARRVKHQNVFSHAKDDKNSDLSQIHKRFIIYCNSLIHLQLIAHQIWLKNYPQMMN